MTQNTNDAGPRLAVPGWLAMSPAQRFLLLSILIGIFGGLLVVCFHITIEFIGWFALGTGPDGSLLGTLFSPTLGAVMAVFVVMRLFRAAQGSGINHTKAGLYISDGYIPASTVVGKFLACSLSLGSGNSLGPEDPALQMGAGVASWLGRLFRLSREDMRLVAPVGAAAGLAAAFNTPITAVLFVVEEVLAAWNAAVLGSIMLAAVSAVVISRWFLGDQPLFRVPEFTLTHPSELLIYAAMGAAGGVLSALFVKAVVHLRKRLALFPSGSKYTLPLAAGLVVGCVGIWLPDVMGPGYRAVDSALMEQYPWPTLLLLGFAKIAVTALCFSAGTPGGMFAPTLFVGAMIGGGMGTLAHNYWMFPTSSAGAYVLVGMGTFFAGVFRAPMTSIFMVFEVSASYVIILPVMIANTISYLVSRRLQSVPFFDLIARQEGLDLPSPEEQRERRILRVEDAMQPASLPLLYGEVKVSEALQRMQEEDAARCLVFGGSRRWALVTREDLDLAVTDQKAEAPVASAVRLRPIPRLYPDLSLGSALRLFGSRPLLPVISRANPRQLLGVLTLENVHKAFGIRQS